ncbi:hypothetical protein [Nostoc sp.]
MPVTETNPKIPMPSPSLYETDFYAWTKELARCILFIGRQIFQFGDRLFK